MKIGDKIRDRYRIDEEIGSGGMSRVFRAFDGVLGRDVAVKATKEGYGSLTQREGRALAQLAHSNIVQVFDRFEEEGQVLTIMELVNGKPLSETGNLSISEILSIFVQVLQALKFAHSKGIVHRDLKPANIMVNKVENEWAVKVLDFGIAKILNPEKDETVTMGAAGTLHYMSPEQITAPLTLDHRSDLYSIGKTFYELLAGRLPYEKNSSSNYEIQKQIVETKFKPPSYYNPQIPRDIDRVIEKAIEKKRDRRFQTASDMLNKVEALEKKYADLSAFPDNKTERDFIPYVNLGRKYSLSKIALGIGVVIVLATMGFFTTNWLSESAASGNQQENGPTENPVSPGPEYLQGNEQPGPTLSGNNDQGSIFIRVVQPGSIIRLDDLIARDSLIDHQMAPGTYSLEVYISDWFETHREEVTIRTGESTIINGIDLAPLGELRLLVPDPEDVLVYVDGELSEEQGSQILYLTEGRHRVGLMKSGYEDRSFFVNIKHMDTKRITESLEPITPPPIQPDPAKPLIGKLIVNPQPFGDVYINNRRVLKESHRSVEELEYGSYNIRVTHPHYGRWDSTVVLDQSERIVRFNFNDNVDVRVAYALRDEFVEGAKIFIDGAPTPYVTPAAIPLSPGYHEIYAVYEKTGARSETHRFTLHAGSSYPRGRYKLQLK